MSPQTNARSSIALFALLTGTMIARVGAQTTRSGAAVKVAVLPLQPLIERRGSDRLLNFDFILTNPSRVPVRLSAVEVSVYDTTGALEIRRFIDGNGQQTEH